MGLAGASFARQHLFEVRCEGERSTYSRPLLSTSAARGSTCASPLGAAQLEGKREPEALDSLLRAKAQYEKLHPKASPAFADLLVNVARAQLALGRSEDAVAASGQAAEFWKSFDQANRSTGLALLWHARALTANGDAPKAMNALRQASEILAKTGLPADRLLLTQVRSELRAKLR